jgi:hypothetical protein
MIDGKRVEPTAFATETVGAKKVQIAGHALPELTSYLQLMGSLKAETRSRSRPDGVKVGLTPEQHARLVRQLNQQLDDWGKVGDPAKPLIREPVFLVALRYIVDMVNNGEVTLSSVQE